MARFRFGSSRARQRRAAESPPPHTPSADAVSTEPVTPPTPRATKVPLSVALLNRRSLGGAAVVLLSALFFILVIPALDDLIEHTELEVGTPLAVGENLLMTPAQGWALSPDSTQAQTILTNSGTQIVVTPAQPLSQPVADQIQDASDALANDPDKSWVVTEPTTFTTLAGDPGATVTAQSKETSTQSWIVTHDGSQATVVLVAPVAVWDAVSEGATDIVESLQFAQTVEP